MLFLFNSLTALAFVVSCFVIHVPAHAQNFPLTHATYLGGTQNDKAGGVDFAPDGSLYFGGQLVDTNPGGVTPTTILGGGDGIVLKLNASGDQVLKAARLGSGILDLEIASDGSLIVAAENLGIVALNSELDQVLWHAMLIDIARVAAGGSVRAALTSAKTVHTFDAAGNALNSQSFSDSVVDDLAADLTGGRLVVAGFNNRNTNGGTPVQIPFIRSFDPQTFILQWKAYDWTASQVEQTGSLADSRGNRVAFGADGHLYFAGRADGGTSTFRYDPLDFDRLLGSNELIAFDDHSQTFNTGGPFITYFGRFDPATGGVLKMQAALSRLSSGRGNTVVPSSIDANASGRVILGGQAFATIANRDELTAGGVPVGPYQGGEAYVMVVPPNFQGREFWTVFTAADGSQGTNMVGVAIQGANLAFTASLSDTAQMITQNPLQPMRGTGDEAFFGTLSALFQDGFDSGNTAAWTVTIP